MTCFNSKAMPTNNNDLQQPGTLTGRVEQLLYTTSLDNHKTDVTHRRMLQRRANFPLLLCT